MFRGKSNNQRNEAKGRDAQSASGTPMFVSQPITRYRTHSVRPYPTASSRRRLGRYAAAFALLILLVACRPPQKMADQPQYDPYEASNFYPDGMSARQPVAGTVARGSFHDDEFLYTGKVNGAVVDSFPFPVTKEVLLRGEERFNIYCSECHGRRGLGDGMIVRRGYRKPPSYHDPRIKAMPVGHYFDVMTNGFGAMPPYAAQVTVEDRWMIAAYIRALQLSYSAPLSAVPPAEAAKLQGVTR